ERDPERPAALIPELVEQQARREAEGGLGEVDDARGSRDRRDPERGERVQRSRTDAEERIEIQLMHATSPRVGPGPGPRGLLTRSGDSPRGPAIRQGEKRRRQPGRHADGYAAEMSTGALLMGTSFPFLAWYTYTWRLKIRG